MTHATREPLLVHCGTCGHEWAPAFLPAPLDVIGQLTHLRCPRARCRGEQFMGPRAQPVVPRADRRDGDPIAWLKSGDTGTSSETIFSVLTGYPVRHTGTPADPSDFGRCYRLLQVMPSWRARMGEVAAAHPAWRPFVDAWEELTALYEHELAHGPVVKGVRQAPKTYGRMLQLRGLA